MLYFGVFEHEKKSLEDVPAQMNVEYRILAQTHRKGHGGRLLIEYKSENAVPQLQI
jgi:hypothetical protein